MKDKTLSLFGKIDLSKQEQQDIEKVWKEREQTNATLQKLAGALQQKGQKTDLTDKQLGYLSNWLHMNHYKDLAPHALVSPKGTPYDAPLVGAEQWLRKHIDKRTASDLISDLMAEKEDVVWNQLKHLGLPTK